MRQLIEWAFIQLIDYVGATEYIMYNTYMYTSGVLMDKG